MIANEQTIKARTSRHRRHDRILSPARPNRQPLRNKAKASDKQTLAPQCIHDNSEGDPDLAEIMDAWSGLPKAIRQGIIAIVRGSTRTGD
jgi:hypothetical protein